MLNKLNKVTYLVQRRLRPKILLDILFIQALIKNPNRACVVTDLVYLSYFNKQLATQYFESIIISLDCQNFKIIRTVANELRQV